MAAGVLPICIGRATKIVELIQNDKKRYRCEMTLGAVTDTQDMWGTVLESHSFVGIDRLQVEEVAKKFVGDIEQIPPMFSALKVNGKKLYELAREGVTVERKPRIRSIYEIDIIKVDGPRVWMDVVCSKGTYIRTLCHDIGAELGCGAHMSFLLRTGTGIFTLENGISLETLQSLKNHPERIEKHMLSVDEALCELPSAHVPAGLEAKLKNGVRINLAEYCDESALVEDRLIRIYVKNQFLGIAKCQETQVKMVTLFNLEASL